MLTLTTLGGWGLAHDANGALGQSPSKTLALLAYLACAPGGTARREQLVDLLWADVEPDTADHALRQMVWMLRYRLGDESIGGSVGTLTLAAPLVCDRDLFLAAIAAQRYDEAVKLYRGEFLPGFAAPGGAEFEKWADLERRRLRTYFVNAAETLARGYMAEGRFREAMALARRARDADPEHEAGWRLLIEALIASGDQLSAEVEVEQLRRLLEVERRTAEPATLAVIRRAARDNPVTAPQRSRALVLELVGRERQFTAITAAWDDVREGRGRHVHVSGAAGLGKTRLLQDAARRLAAAGATTVEIRANPGERTLRFASAADAAFALAQLPGSTGVGAPSANALVALNPRLSARYPLASGQLSAAVDAPRVYTLAFTELLESLAEEGPLAIMVDDVHWADTESRRLLEAVLPRLVGRRVLVVTSGRPEAQVVSRPDTTELTLEPLDEHQVALLLSGAAALPAADWAAGLPVLLQRSSMGSPFLIMESLRLAAERRLLVAEEGQWRSDDPGALVDLLASGTALHERVAQLTRDKAWLLLLLALSGIPLADHLLKAAVPRDPASILEDLRELDRLGLAMLRDGAWLVGHDEIADHAIAVATAEQRQAAHAALGRGTLAFALERTDFCRAARHLEAADLTDELREAVRRAVEQARDDGDRRPVAALVAGIVGRERDSAVVRRLVRSLPLGARVGRRALAVGIAALAFLVLALGTSLPRFTSHGPGILLGVWRPDPDGRMRLYTHELTAAEAAAHTVPRDAFERSELLAYLNDEGSIVPGDGSALLTRRTYRDSGAMDVVLLRVGAEPVRLTRTPGDDYPGTFSPDGRLAVIATDRWSQASQSDLAIVDPARPDSIVRRLTFDSLGRDITPLWSPDGTRILFWRIHQFGRAAPPDWCIVTVDGNDEQCHQTSDAGSLVGWAGPRAVVLSEGGEAGPGRIVVVELETGAKRVIAQGFPSYSRTPGWLTCLCRRNADEPYQRMLIEVAHPDQAIVVDEGRSPGAVEVFEATRSSRYLASLRITGGERPIPLDAGWHLQLDARDAGGRAVVPTAIRWWSSDSAIVAVDGDGELRPRAIGTAVVHVTAGGWLGDTAIVRVAPAAAPTVLSEDWRGGIAPHWVAFGTPRPFVVTYARQQWLAPNGDSTDLSGVVSRARFPAAAGIGVETTVRMPLTALQWQSMHIGIHGADSASLAAWDLENGRPVLPQREWRECGFTYPATMSGLRTDRLLQIAGGAVSGVELSPAVAAGAPVTIRLQLFPDGRCGIAVNGRPQPLVNRHIEMGDSTLVLIHAYSHRTRFLVGPVEIWSGVRPDVDWREGARVP